MPWPIPAPYQNNRLLTEAFGNNAFDFNQRYETPPEPTLAIAALKPFDQASEALQQLKIGTHPAFELYEENKIKSFYGLQNFLLFPAPLTNSPVFVFDNHNHAFFFWHWWTTIQKLPHPFTLIHIDQHKDMRLPATFLSPTEAQDIEQLDQYTTNILNVGNFITPALKTGLIKDIIMVDSTQSLQNLLQQALPEHFILDIDLDFFSPELDWLDNQLKLQAIKKALPKAKIITIATSPYFMDQTLAFNWLRQIFPND